MQACRNTTAACGVGAAGGHAAGPSGRALRPRRSTAHRRALPLATALQATNSGATESVKLSVRVRKACGYGNGVRAVGSHPALGDWNPSAGATLTWSEGDVFRGEVDIAVAAGENVAFKFVMVDEATGEPLEWEACEDRLVAAGELASNDAAIACDFGDGSARVTSAEAFQMQEAVANAASAGSRVGWVGRDVYWQTSKVRMGMVVRRAPRSDLTAFDHGRRVWLST